MKTVREAIGEAEAAPGEQAQGLDPEVPSEMIDIDAEPVPQHPLQQVLDFLRKPTGQGSIGQYTEHPLNFDSSQAVARVLRGLTGLFGDLDLALVDIAIGLFERMTDSEEPA